MAHSENISSIFRTNKIPTTHISQNHLDALDATIINFCDTHKDYTWYLVAHDGRKIEAKRISAHIAKHQPKTIRYVIDSPLADRQLLLVIEDGITLNLKNGSPTLYGLYGLLNDAFETVKVPSPIAYLRKYWLLNSFLAIWFIPILVFLIFRNSAGAILWLILTPLTIFFLAGAILNEENNFLEKLEWEDVVLSTKIQYGTYRVKAGSPVLSVLSSTKTMISIGASLATILSFIFFLAQQR